MEIENEWNSKVSPKKNCIASDDQKDKTAMYLDNCINDGSLDSNGDIVILSKTILNYLEEVSPENKDTTVEKIDEDVIDKKNNVSYQYRIIIIIIIINWFMERSNNKTQMLPQL